MIHFLDAEAFYHKTRNLPLIDVRSPLEFQRGHIPGAHNIFLFDDDERALLGLLYVKKSQDEAIQKGRELANSRLTRYLEDVLQLAPGKKVCVHCWRGGMRSSSFAELLSKNGFEVTLLKGGYKAYRNLVLDSFSQQAPVIVLGGMTGSGKTRILKMLATQGIQMVDLEDLAHHKGSVFGAMNQPQQPSSQQFENNLYEVWSRLDFHQPVLLEDENYDIGSVKLPYALWQQIRTAPLLQVKVSREQRIVSLMREYAAQDDELLLSGIRRIERRLGLEQAQTAVAAVIDKNYQLATEILLDYYDKSYLASTDKRPVSRVFDTLHTNSQNPGEMQLLVKEIQEIYRRCYLTLSQE